MYNDTYLNILASYAYITNPAFFKRLRELASTKRINLMIDSGAFTKYNASAAFEHVTLDKYCNFCESIADVAEKYVMLDVIGNAEASHRNYETMISRGLSPMFVVTMFDNDYKYMRDAIKNNPNICVAGGATTKGLWMKKRYQDIYKQSDRKAKIHRLAYVTYPSMLQLPLSSVDSSSWKASALRFGNLQYFDHGLKSISHKNVLRGREALHKKEQIVLNNLHVTPAMYAREEFHRGDVSIEALGSIQANITMQKVCKRAGLNYFLAVSCLQDLEKVLYIDDNFDNLYYESFRKEFKK